MERLRHLVAHIDAHQIHQLERAHPEAAAEAHDPVDLLGSRQPLLKEPQRLGAEGPVAAVHKEAGAVLGGDRDA